MRNIVEDLENWFEACNVSRASGNDSIAAARAIAALTKVAEDMRLIHSGHLRAPKDLLPTLAVVRGLIVIGEMVTPLYHADRPSLVAVLGAARSLEDRARALFSEAIGREIAPRDGSSDEAEDAAVMAAR